jgi:cell wall-associated NlpC family hydrolase
VSRAAILLLAAASAACATTGATPTPRPFPVPGRPSASAAAPEGALPVVGPRDAYALTGTALSLRGIPYRNGGADPAGFDCSGLVRYVFAQHGVTMPRTVAEQFQAGEPVHGEYLPGDLVFFTTVAPGPSHVGISLGGDEFVHAPSSSGVVRVERLSAPYWASRFVGVRRLPPSSFLLSS